MDLARELETNRVDVPAALPIEHVSLGAVAFDPRISNLGDATAGGNCWCLQTLPVGQSPATFSPAQGQWGTGDSNCQGCA